MKKFSSYERAGISSKNKQLIKMALNGSFCRMVILWLRNGSYYKNNYTLSLDPTSKTFYNLL
tara:strand:+ start:110 stop:295 length:186 start_codon:yes stop_codon:yes gene_type:complete